MGIGQVRNMNVISHTGAIFGGVVGAKDINGISLAQGCLQDQGNQMSFQDCDLPLKSLPDGTGSVEVAKAHRFQIIGFVVVRENPLNHELGHAIRG